MQLIGAFVNTSKTLARMACESQPEPVTALNE